MPCGLQATLVRHRYPTNSHEAATFQSTRDFLEEEEKEEACVPTGHGSSAVHGDADAGTDPDG